MTKIEWVKNEDGSHGETWNPIVGCSILSPGCTNCYAMRMAARIEAMNHEARETERSSGKKRPAAAQYDGTTKIVNGSPVWTGKMQLAGENVLLAPLKRKKTTTYFVNSMGDLFHENVPDEWIDQVFAVMALCPQHTFQVLTKRAERMREYMSRAVDMSALLGATFTSINTRGRIDVARATELNHRITAGAMPWPLPNVWLGVSTERQKEADERIPLLLQTPAAIRFISAEPLLGPIDLNRIHEGYDTPEGARVDMWESALNGKRFDIWSDGDTEGHPKLDWVIVGGESGPDARPMHPDWARALRDQCAAAGTKFFFKQWGEWRQRDCVHVAREHAVFNPDGSLTMGVGAGTAIECLRTHVVMERMGKSRAGRELDGVTHDDMPGQPDHVITPPARRAAAAE